MPPQETREAIAARKEARETFWNLHKKSEYCCPDCGDDVDHYEVHHIDGDPFNNALDNLVGLCHSCHVARHREDAIDDRLQEMRTEFAALGD